MTCIVGFVDKQNKKVIIGGDSASSNATLILTRKDPKVFKNGNFVIGGTTYFRMIQLLRFSFKHPEIGDYKIPCYVLEDGQRILSTTGMQRALGIVNDEKERSATRLAEILSSKVVSSYISDNSISAKLTPIICYNGKTKISGYPARTLTDMCKICTHLLRKRPRALHFLSIPPTSKKSFLFRGYFSDIFC